MLLCKNLIQKISLLLFDLVYRMNANTLEKFIRYLPIFVVFLAFVSWIAGCKSA